MSRQTGRTLADDAHLAQSIGDILTTPRGSRVMRRAYGSDLPQVIDAPLNGLTIVDLYVAVAEAIDEWEPRITLERVQVGDLGPGHAVLDLQGLGPDGQPTLLQVEVPR